MSLAALVCAAPPSLAQSDAPQDGAEMRFSKHHKFLGATQAGSRASMYVDIGSHVWRAEVVDEASGSTFNVHTVPQLLIDSRDVLPWTDRIKRADGKSVFSRFTTFNRLRVNLLQTLEPGPLPGAYLMTRRFHFVNLNATAVDVPVVFVLRAKVYDKHMNVINRPVIVDYGHLAHSSQWAYVMNRPAPLADRLTNFIGLSGAGLGRTELAVMKCCDDAAFDDRMVDGDVDGDRTSDSPGYRMLVGRRWLHLEPGQAQTMTFDTLFGRSMLTSLDDLPSHH